MTSRGGAGPNPNERLTMLAGKGRLRREVPAAVRELHVAAAQPSCLQQWLSVIAKLP